jgi:adenylyltransferase/sulfurtransferase
MYKQAARLVAEKGYSNVMTFSGGIPEWIKSGYALEMKDPLEKVDIPTVSVDELKGLLNSVTILDIRAPSLYEMGWLPGSVKIPLEKLSTEYETLSREKPLVVVDHAGKQVITAARFLKSKKYGDVKRLKGGLMAWSVKGLALEK